MKRKTTILLLVSIMLLGMATQVAASANVLSLPWWTVDGGGGTSQGGNYVLSGTIGQPDGSHIMSADSFSLVGGFWANGEEATVLNNNATYLPIVTR